MTIIRSARPGNPGSNPAVGIIGTGNMGLAIARRLLSTGLRVHLLPRRLTQPITQLEQTGCVVESSSLALMNAVDVVLLALPTDGAVMSVVRDDSTGLLTAPSAAKRVAVVDMGTTSPHVATHVQTLFRESAHVFVDAPVSGGPRAAETGRLSIMVGGEENDPQLQQAYWVLRVLGENIEYLGAVGAGQIAKACNQVVVAAHLAQAGEAMVFAQRLGVSREAAVHEFRQVSAVLQERAEIVWDRQYDHVVMARSSIQLKDMGVVHTLATHLAVAMPISGLVRQLLVSLVGSGGADWDQTAVADVFHRLGRPRDATATPPARANEVVTMLGSALAAGVDMSVREALGMASAAGLDVSATSRAIASGIVRRPPGSSTDGSTESLVAITSLAEESMVPMPVSVLMSEVAKIWSAEPLQRLAAAPGQSSDGLTALR